MKIVRKTVGDVDLLSFTGEFDAFNLPKISEKIDELVKEGHRKLVLNFHYLKFINSSALGYLVKTQKEMKDAGGELVLSQPSKFFQSTIRTLGVDSLFKIFANDDEAVSYYLVERGESQKLEGVLVDEKLLGSTTLFFKVLGETESPMGAGKILSIYEDGPSFKYPADPDKVKVDPVLLKPETKLWLKFRQPFLEKERFFESEGEIVERKPLEGEEAAQYRVRYTKISPEDKKVLDQFVKDQEYLRSVARSKG